MSRLGSWGFAILALTAIACGSSGSGPESNGEGGSSGAGGTGGSEENGGSGGTGGTTPAPKAGDPVWIEYMATEAYGLSPLPGGGVVWAGSLSGPKDKSGYYSDSPAAGILDAAGQAGWSDPFDVAAGEQDYRDVDTAQDGSFRMGGSAELGFTFQSAVISDSSSFIASRNADGSFRWVTPLNIGETPNPWVDVHVDGNGNAFVSGNMTEHLMVGTTSFGDGKCPTCWGAFLLLLDSTGAPKWGSVFKSATTADHAVVSSGASVAYADGTFGAGFTSSLGGIDGPGVSTSAEGGVWARIGADGKLLWKVEGTGHFTTLGPAGALPDGRSVVFVETDGQGTFGPLTLDAASKASGIVVIDADGKNIKTLPFDDDVSAMAIGANGDIVLAGGNGLKAAGRFVAKLSSDGNTLWRTDFTVGKDSVGFCPLPSSVAIDGSGTVYMAITQTNVTFTTGGSAKQLGVTGQFAGLIAAFAP